MSHIPTISIEFDVETEQHVLLATSYLSTQPAGPRLFRAGPWPEIRFAHENAESAEKDAATLRAYLDDCAAGRRKGKEDAVIGRGWWED